MMQISKLHSALQVWPGPKRLITSAVRRAHSVVVDYALASLIRARMGPFTNHPNWDIFLRDDVTLPYSYSQKAARRVTPSLSNRVQIPTYGSEQMQIDI